MARYKKDDLIVDEAVVGTKTAEDWTSQGFTLVPTPTDIITTGTLKNENLIAYNTPTTPAIADISKIDTTIKTPELTMTPTQTQAQDFTTQIQELNKMLIGESAYTTQQETTQGLPALQTTQTDLTNQMMALKNEMLDLQNQYATIPSRMQEGAGGRGITTGGLAPLTAGELRKNQIKQSEIASRALSISAMLQATQGNIATAQSFINRAVKQKFDPIREEIAVKIANLELLLKSPQLSLEEKNQAQKQLDYQNNKKIEIAKQEQEETAVKNIAIEAAKNGADSLILDKINKSKTAVEAMRLAAEFTDENIKLKQAETKTQKEFENKMALEGYVKLLPSQLAGLIEQDILRMPNGDIYKKPAGKTGYETKFETAGGRNLMITYNPKTGDIVKQIDLGGAYKAGGGRGGTQKPVKPEDAMAEQLSTVVGKDGFISPDDYLTARNAWISVKLSPTTFDTKFRGFRNPNNPYYITEKKKETNTNRSLF